MSCGDGKFVGKDLLHLLRGEVGYVWDFSRLGATVLKRWSREFLYMEFKLLYEYQTACR
jgi:hypothetical protein